MRYAQRLFVDGDLQKGIRPKGFDQIYAVFDRDDHESYFNALNLATSLDGKLRNDDRQAVSFKAIASVPSFELWLLLHYEDLQAPISRDMAIARLKQYIPGYDKGAVDSFATTSGRLETATQRALALAAKFNAHTAPERFTAVNELVKLLTTLRCATEVNACTFRVHLLTLGLKPVTVRKQTAILNAMLNVAFRYLDIDRLSPFRALRISGVEIHRPMRVITHELMLQVKEKLMTRFKPFKFIGLVQLNTGLRLSEPVYARVEDCVLDHPIPHIWIRRNELSNRKNKSSIRAVPLIGVSLFAARRLVDLAKCEGSEWLVPQYAHYHGSNSCSAIMNKYLADLEFRSHMFRHGLIDRMKACNDIPTRLAESITGHSSGGSEFNNYGTVGYTLEQKLEVLKRIAI